MPGLVGLIGVGASGHIAPMCAPLWHRGQKPKVFTLGQHGVIAILDDRMDASWSTEGNWQLGAHLRDYSQPHDGRAGARTASRLLQRVRAGKWEQLADWNGHFALAAWDADNKQLLLGRDYFGFFPLFYASNGHGLFGFASEYKALLTMPFMQAVPDLGMLHKLQFAKKVSGDQSLISNISPVEPGQLVRFDVSGTIVDSKNMPPLKSVVRFHRLAEVVGPTYELIQGAVEGRTRGTGSIGIALSGGIDSIAVACICRKMYPQREICTFTTGYGGDDPDLITARRVAELLGSTHFEVPTPPDLIRTGASELVWHLEDPVGRSETLQLLAVGKKAAEHVPLLLSGQGADGLFGGMPRHRLIRYMELFPPLRNSLKQLYDFTQYGSVPDSAIAKLAVWMLGGKTPEPPPISGSQYAAEATKWPATSANLLNDFTSEGYTSNPKFERTLAASGLDYTSPFFDPTLVNHAYSIDSKLKITMKTQKYVLREALRGVVPDEVLGVPKRPQRMRYDLEFFDALDDLCRDILNDKAVASRGWFNAGDIANLRRTSRTVAYLPEHAMRIWTAVLIEIWGKLFVDGSGTKTAAAVQVPTAAVQDPTAPRVPIGMVM